MNTYKSIGIVVIGVLFLLLQGCATMDSLKKEAGYGIKPAGQCEVQQNWQAIATPTDFVNAAKEQSSIVSVRLLPEWAIQNYLGFTLPDKDEGKKIIKTRLVSEVIFFPQSGGYETYYGYPSTDMKYLNVVIPGKTKAHFKGGNWLFPSGSYRSTMTANGDRSEIVPVKLNRDNGCFETFESKAFFKAHPSQKVSIRDTISTEKEKEAIQFLLVKLGEEFAQDFTVEDKKFFAASQEDTIRAAGLTNESTGLDSAISTQSVPIHAGAFFNPITAGLQMIPIALFLNKAFDDQAALRGPFPEATLTREEASVSLGQMLLENQNQATYAMKAAAFAIEELRRYKESHP